MKKGRTAKRWTFVLVIFFFLVFHQLDVFLLKPITAQMLSVLNVRDIWIEPLITLNVGVSILFALLWGYWFDRHSRIKILALIGFFWGVTSWLTGISPTLTTYIISSASGGIDNVGVSGVFALAADFFSSKNRGKIFGLFLISQPLALMMVIFISNALKRALNWRLLLILMAVMAFLFTLLIYFILHEPKRGSQERGMTNIRISGIYLIDWNLAKESLKAPSLLLIYFFSLIGTMPWYILTTWISPYFQGFNQVTPQTLALRLLPALIAVMIGFPIGGFLGDTYARKHEKGRVTIAILGVFLPSVFLLLAFLINDFADPAFQNLFILMGLFMAFSWPNMLALICAITIPEVRSFTTSIGLALNVLGGLIGPYFVSILQFHFGLRNAILWVTIGAWLLGFLSLSGLFVTLPRDIENLRRHMAYRSHLERRLNQSKPRREA